MENFLEEDLKRFIDQRLTGYQRRELWDALYFKLCICCCNPIMQEISTFSGYTWKVAAERIKYNHGLIQFFEQHKKDMNTRDFTILTNENMYKDRMRLKSINEQMYSAHIEKLKKSHDNYKMHDPEKRKEILERVRRLYFGK